MSVTARAAVRTPVVVFMAAAVVAIGTAVAVDRLTDRGPTGGPPGAAAVVEIIDGDTLVVDVRGHREPVRLIGVDTPETIHPDRPEECYGAEASRRLDDLVPPGTAVRLERDIEPRDQYDRLLAYVYRAEDGLFVNLDQVSHGYADTLVFPPNTAHEEDFARAERAARTAGVGLWSACGGADVPVEPG